MNSAIRRCVPLLLVAVGGACSLPALAGYEYTSVDPFGAITTQLWGVNSSGRAVGNAFTGSGDITFVYDVQKGSYTPIAPMPGYDRTGLLGINDAGAMAGNVTDGGGFDSGVVRGKNGAYTAFAHPDCDYTSGRAIGNTGLVTGFADTCVDYDSVGFIYDPASGSFTDFLPSSNSAGIPTIPQGINARGQVVGSVYLEGTDAPAGDGLYGFLRNANGDITLFRVNGAATRARGITNYGLITGFITTSDGLKGFVLSVAPGPAYQTFAIDDADLLVVPFAGAVNTTPQSINEAGIVSGQWSDGGGAFHGFIATPVPPKKK